MNILVTGGAGYVGSVLVPMLAFENEVRVLDSFIYGQTSLLDACSMFPVEIIRGDVRDESLMEELLKDIDYIIPLAAIVGAPACDKDPNAAYTTNCQAIKSLLKLRRKGQFIIYPCTNSGYGVGHPQRDKLCTEDTPLDPISLYGRLKVDAEREIMNAGDAISLRLATVFGASPRMRTDLLVNDFVFRAVTDGYIVLYQGNFRRNYIHVRDVARAFMHIIRRRKRSDEIFNVGLSDANLSKLELCKEIKKQVPGLRIIEAEAGDDPDKRDYIVSNEKIEATGFKPMIRLSDGIEELIKAYQIVRHPMGNI